MREGRVKEGGREGRVGEGGWYSIAQCSVAYLNR